MHFRNLLDYNKIFFKNRRGISQVIGSLLLLAIVVPLGTVVLVNGTTEINAFNNEMRSSVVFNNQGIREQLVFEHVRFDPLSDTVEITVLNSGSVETFLDRVTIVNMTSQKILFSIAGVSSVDTTPVQIKDSRLITVNANLESGCLVWDCGLTTDHEYKISIITARGNFFDTVARPFNT